MEGLDDKSKQKIDFYTRQFIDAMAEKEVFVGRPWPIWPTHDRISLGSEAEMARFEAAFLQVVREAGV